MTTTTTRKPSRPRPHAGVRAAVELLRQHGLAPGELSLLLGLSQAWTTRSRSAGLPCRPDGRHDLAAVLEWIRARDRERPVPLAKGERESPELERWRKARADLAEIDLAHRHGRLIERAEVVDFAVGAIVAVRQRMGDMVKKVAARIGPLCGRGGTEHVETELRSEVDAICAGFEHGMQRTHDTQAPPVPSAGVQHEDTQPTTGEVDEDATKNPPTDQAGINNENEEPTE